MNETLYEILRQLCWIAHETTDEQHRSELMTICEKMHGELNRMELAQEMTAFNVQSIISAN